MKTINVWRCVLCLALGLGTPSFAHAYDYYVDILTGRDGVIDLSQATVKEEIVKEALDPDSGAVISLGGDSPTLTTAPTRAGLTYEFYEATTLETVGADLRAARPNQSKTGDGSAWSPTISVKEGASGFYSIGVKK